jgi:hypothetical protein
MRDAMSQDNLYSESDGLRSIAQTHADVSNNMSGLANSGKNPADVAMTHGSIASGVHNALGGALDSRRGVQLSVADAGRNLADSLRQAAHQYEGVDAGSAERLKKAADALDGAPATASAGGMGSAGMKDVAGMLTGAGKDVAGAMGGVIGPMTSALGSAASSLGSGLSSAAGTAANSITQAVGNAAKAVPGAGAVPSVGAVGGGDQHAGPTENGRPTSVSEGGDQAKPGDGTAPGRVPEEHVRLARSTSGQEGGGGIVV